MHIEGETDTLERTETVDDATKDDTTETKDDETRQTDDDTDGGKETDKDTTSQDADDKERPSGVTFSDNWREDMVAKLGLSGEEADRALKQARRWASPYDAFKSGIAAQTKIGELTEQTKGMVKIPGKDATDEEKAAYRKAVGVPEKPEDYVLARPKDDEGNEIQPTENDKILEGELLKTAHAQDFNQQQLGAVWELHNRVQGMAEKMLEDEASALAQETEDNLRVEYGKDYRQNMELADRFLAEHLGADAENFMTMKLEGKSTIGSFEPFVKMIVKFARAEADDGLLEMGGATEAKSDQDRYNEIIEMRKTDREQYQSQAVQDELKKVTDRINRRKAREEQPGEQ